MNQEIKTKWITALLSGDYQQGKGALARVGGDDVQYCCLGVLCDIAYKEGVVERVELVGDEGANYYRYGEEYGVLPDVVRRWAGIDSGEGNPMLGDPITGSRTSLAWMNDSGNKDFGYIAEAIEKGL